MTTGLKDLYFAPITMTDGQEVWGEPQKLAEAITADLSVNVAEATLYADDALNQSVKEFTNGTIKLGVADLAADVDRRSGRSGRRLLQQLHHLQQ